MSIGIAIILLLGFTFRPIQNINESQCAIAEGVVKEVAESGTKDISIFLENHTNSFYINRAIEQGFDLGVMKDTLIGKPVKIWYVHQYSLLTLFSDHKHISRLDIGRQTIFNEWIAE